MLTVTKGGTTLASASAGATQEELDKAIGLTAEESQAAKNEAEKEIAASAAKEEPAESAPAPETGNVESEEEDDQKRDENGRFKNSPNVQKRIDKAVRAQREAERRAEAAERRLADLNQASGKPAAQEKPAASADDPEPVPDDAKFKTYEEYVKAQARWEARQELKAEREREIKQAADAELKEQWNSHLERVAEARKVHDDFDEVVGQTRSQAVFSDQGIQAFELTIVELPNGAEVLYHLAKHADELNGLGKFSPIKITGELWRLSAQLTSQNPPAKKGENKEEKEDRSPDPEPRSAAPAPIKPVGGSSAKSTADRTADGLAAYIERRNNGTYR